jgi:hypothetical protein
MNNRDYKFFAPDCYYHIFNRGNSKQEVFLDNEDRKFFLLRLKENLYPQKTLFMPPDMTKSQAMVLPPRRNSLLLQE